MPLLQINPSDREQEEQKPPALDFKSVLREAGLIEEGEEVEPGDLPELLQRNRLSPEHILPVLRDMIDNADSDHTKMTALTKAMEMNRMLKPESQQAGVSFTVVIKDPQQVGINPILLPREMK